MKSNLISYGEISVPGTQLLRMHLRGRSCTLRIDSKRALSIAGQQDKQHSSELYIL